MLPLTTAYFMTAGMMVISACYSWCLARSSSLRDACTYFVYLNICFAGFQICSALQYQSNTVDGAVFYHKWLNGFQLLIFAFSAQFLNTFLRVPKPDRHSSLVILLATIGFFLNLIAPYGYRFSDINTAPTMSFWGEPLFILYGHLSPQNLLVIPMALLLAHKIYKGVSQRSGNQRPSFIPPLLLWCGLLHLIVCIITTKLSDAGIVKIPYLAGFGFVILSSAFAYLIKQDLVGLTRSKLRKFHKKQHELLLPGSAGKKAIHGLLRQLRISKRSFSLFVFEIDRFDQITAADKWVSKNELGQRVVDELSNALLIETKVRRIAENRFVSVVESVSDPKLVSALCSQIKIHFLNNPLHIGSLQLRITLCFGVVISQTDGLAWQNPLQAAELALSEAKSAGLNSHRFYDDNLGKTFSKKIEYEGALLNALEQEQFVLFFQPQISVLDGRPVGIEALIRWNHPELGFVPPADFIPIAESSGLINEMGLWIIESACKNLAAIHILCGETIRLAINVSAHQLTSDRLEAQILMCLDKFNLPPSSIELEVTESAAIEFPEEAIARLLRLKDMGIRLAIDDFGTGYSSLSYLHKLPVHALKLDKSFINGMGNGDVKAFSICKNAINLARDLGLEVVAEGVETEAQSSILKQMGCNLLQGFLYSKPMPAGLLVGYLQDQNKSLAALA